jgi:hypothetical protein
LTFVFLSLEKPMVSTIKFIRFIVCSLTISAAITGLTPVLTRAQTGVTLTLAGFVDSYNSDSQTITEGQVTLFEYTIHNFSGSPIVFYPLPGLGSPFYAQLSSIGGSDVSDTQAQVQVIPVSPFSDSCQAFPATGPYLYVGSSCSFFVTVQTSLDPTEADTDFGKSSLAIEAAYQPITSPTGPNILFRNNLDTLTIQDPIPAATTPEPASILFFGTGLLGMALMLRKSLLT